MPLDLTRLLQEWPYEPGQLNVRVVEGDDGLPKIQMRIDLGIIQMEMSGRPDGQRPHGYESLLEYFEAVLDEREEAEGDDSISDDAEPEDEAAGPGATLPEPESEPSARPAAKYALSPEDCRLLREEAVQYYHRYISLLVLGDFQGVLRDTARNLRVLDLCRDHAETEEDRDILEQFRPYISMMRTRAMASQAVADDEPKTAIVALDLGMESLRKQFADLGRSEEFEQATEVQLLRGMRDELTRKLPMSAKGELRQRLQDAISRENYELAAILRDELKNMKD